MHSHDLAGDAKGCVPIHIILGGAMMKRKSKTVLWVTALCAALTACGGNGSGGNGQKDSGAETGQTTSAAATEAQTQGQGAGAAQDGKDSILIGRWGNQDRQNMTIEVLDQYTQETGLPFSYEYTSWNSYFENLATQAVGSNLPDIIQMSTTDIINYSRNGQVIDLQPYIDDGTIDTSYIDKGSLDGGKVDGKQTGFITGVNTVAVAYNKEIFDEAKVEYPSDDWTWSEYLDTAKAVYDATGIQAEIPFLNEPRWVIEAMIRSYGYDFFSEDGNSLPWAEDEKVVSALTGMIKDVYDGVKEGYLVDPEVQVAWSTPEDFYISKGKSSMSYTLSNAYASYSSLLGKELGMVMIPKLDGGSQTGMYLNSNMYWCISANCKDPGAAAGVLNYLINDEAANQVLGADRGISLSSKIREALSSSADMNVYSKNTMDYVGKVSQVVGATNPADPVNSAEAISTLKTNYTTVMYGEMTPEDCVADFIAQAGAILPR